jgi:hypothetical protein
MDNKDKSKQRFWEANWRFKWWVSSDYRRRVTGAKPWELVHHIDENKSNNNKSNFKVLKPKNWMTAIWVHNSEEHLEKAIKGWKAKNK